MIFNRAVRNVNIAWKLLLQVLSIKYVEMERHSLGAVNSAYLLKFLSLA